MTLVGLNIALQSGDSDFARKVAKVRPDVYTEFKQAYLKNRCVAREKAALYRRRKWRLVCMCWCCCGDVKKNMKCSVRMHSVVVRAWIDVSNLVSTSIGDEWMCICLSCCFLGTCLRKIQR